jgi:predicted GIY-YIG superfamily endonuclease
MGNINNKNIYTYNECKDTALSCNSKGEFREKFPKHWYNSRINNWYDDITSHMKPQPSLKKRCLYKVSYSDGSVYLGLTWNYESRVRDHLGLSRTSQTTTVKRYSDKTNLTPTFERITDYMLDEQASIKEYELINEYKSKGYKLLNKQKGGNLGTLPRLDYTLEYCKSVALKYTTRTSGPNSFKKKELSIYQYCQKQEGWLDIVCSHMTPTSEIRTVWNEEKLIEYIKENNITVRTGKGGLKYLNQAAYRSANRLNLLDKLLPNKLKN